jgi:PAS domain S-box-containing protein
VEQQLHHQDSCETQLEQSVQDTAARSPNGAEQREERLLLRALIDALPDFIFVKNREGKFIVVNQSLLNALGVAAHDEIVGKTDQNYHHEEMAQAFAADDESVMSSGESLISREEVHLDAFGRRRWLSTTKVPMKNARGDVNGVIGISRDISGLKETQEERDAVHRDLARSNRDLEQFAYVVSHDLKAPLRAITNLSTWIEEDLADCLTEDSRQHIDLLRQRVARLDLLISEILKYSRSGKTDVETVAVDSGVLVRNVIAALNLPDGFDVTIASNMPIIETAKTPLEQVFANLIVNAVKHHHDQSQGKIEIAASDMGSLIGFSVKDNGPGIDSQFHDRVFQIFRTLKPVEGANGCGIGLSIVKRLVERYGGEVRLESAGGAGATFYFTWPKELPSVP